MVAAAVVGGTEVDVVDEEPWLGTDVVVLDEEPPVVDAPEEVDDEVPEVADAVLQADRARATPSSVAETTGHRRRRASRGSITPLRRPVDPARCTTPALP